MPATVFPYKRALALSLMAAALLYLLAIFLVGQAQVLAAVSRLGGAGWILLLLASLGSYVCRFWRWQLYLYHLGHRLPWRPSFLYYLSGFALTTTPGKAGETVRSFYLRSHGIPFRHSLAMFFTERLLDVVVVTLLACLALLDFSRFGQLVMIALAGLLLLLPLLRSPRLVHALQQGSRRLRWRRLRQLALKLADLLDAARALLAWPLLGRGLGLGLLAWLLQGLAFLFLLHALQVDIAPATALSIYALGLLAGALSFIPGGIGTTEAVMALLLGYSGAGHAEAVAIPIINRLATLWFAVGLGLLASARIGLSARPDAVANDSAQEIKP